MTVERSKRFHLAGVAGVGMSALAQALQAAGYAVSGSDRFMDQGRGLPVLDQLRGGGISLTPQDGSAITAELDGLVVSTAIEETNPEVCHARELGVPIIHRAEMLARLGVGKRCVAVTGTAGKTTVTGMIGWFMEQAGLDPTVVNGGAVVNWQGLERVGNFRAGRSAWWVIEADESDRSLLQFAPDWAVITNISKDHFELAEVQDLFRRFAAQVKTGIVCGPGVRDCIAPAVTGRATTRLIESAGDLLPAGLFTRFEYHGAVFDVPLAGAHNAVNALAAVMLGEAIGIGLESMRVALSAFRGIQRRLEHVGFCCGAAVIDDYAHNPAKIAAAWAAIRPGASRVLGVWRPHGFGPLKAMQTELADAFSRSVRADDRVYILPVFYAGGTADASFNAEDFVSLLVARGIPAGYAPSYDWLRERMTREAGPDAAILIMGARDPDLPLFARWLAGVGGEERPVVSKP